MQSNFLKNVQSIFTKVFVINWVLMYSLIPLKYLRSAYQDGSQTLTGDQ